MAVSPILFGSLPFDATLSHTLQFAYNGSQVFGHRVIIKNNDTNVTVYNKKVNAMNMFVEIPAKTLTNGNTYNIRVSVFDHEDKESPASNSIIVKCLATPSFEFTNVTDGMFIRNSSFNVELGYSQANGELLNEFNVFVYAANKTTVIYSSGTKYANTSLEAMVTGLIDNDTYYLYATGETVNGMEIATEFVEVVCDYTKPEVFLKFMAENIEDEATVRLTCNFVFVEGKSTPSTLTYIDDEKVSLVNGEKVYWDEGFQAENFTLEVVAENLIDFSKIVTFNMESVKAHITWNYGTFTGDDSPTYYAELTAYQYIKNKRLNYIQMSNRIPPLLENEQIHIWIRHVNGAFDLRIAKYGESEAV